MKTNCDLWLYGCNLILSDCSDILNLGQGLSQCQGQDVLVPEGCYFPFCPYTYPSFLAQHPPTNFILGFCKVSDDSNVLELEKRQNGLKNRVHIAVNPSIIILM